MACRRQKKCTIPDFFTFIQKSLNCGARVWYWFLTTLQKLGTAMLFILFWWNNRFFFSERHYFWRSRYIYTTQRREKRLFRKFQMVLNQTPHGTLTTDYPRDLHSEMHLADDAFPNWSHDHKVPRQEVLCEWRDPESPRLQGLVLTPGERGWWIGDHGGNRWSQSKNYKKCILRTTLSRLAIITRCPSGCALQIIIPRTTMNQIAVMAPGWPWV